MIIRHLESYLGKIERGWADKQSNLEIQVACFGNQPFSGVRTFSTIGLSQSDLSTTSTPIRQELIFSAYDRFAADQLASFLLSFAQNVANEGTALLQGDVIGPSGPIFFGTLLNSLFVSVPFAFDKQFRVLYDSDVPTIFAWLVPIHESEANFARREGWKELDKEFEKRDPDVWDLNRPPSL